ncbi:MAG TPA: carboxypeptidase-like regulatory domain-containing protein, partial [Ferruginibacter sp.]|nr:carboxypeptidase-like regulatory domain-containing protein [Ferruginibacter sp.]
MKIYFLFLFFLLGSSVAHAQNKHTISGYIKDSLNGESLIGATITVQGMSKGISSNQYGFYSITLDEGKYVLVCSFIGYRYKAVPIDLTADTRINFQILPKILLSQEVVISSKKRDANVKNAQMGKITLPIEQIRSIPAFLGEVDLLKT